MPSSPVLVHIIYCLHPLSRGTSVPRDRGGVGEVFSRCVVLHVGGLYVIFQLFVCSPILWNVVRAI